MFHQKLPMAFNLWFVGHKIQLFYRCLDHHWRFQQWCHEVCWWSCPGLCHCCRGQCSYQCHCHWYCHVGCSGSTRSTYSPWGMLPIFTFPTTFRQRCWPSYSKTFKQGFDETKADFLCFLAKWIWINFYKNPQLLRYSLNVFGAYSLFFMCMYVTLAHFLGGLFPMPFLKQYFSQHKL